MKTDHIFMDTTDVYNIDLYYQKSIMDVYYKGKPKHKALGLCIKAHLICKLTVHQWWNT